jgi:hypothetical protein
MRYGVTFILLLLTAGLTLMPTGPLLADDEVPRGPPCSDRLINIEQRLADADIGARRQEQIRQIIDGARTLDQLGDAARCTDLAEQLDDLLKTL